MTIQELINVQQIDHDITFTPVSYNADDKSIQIRIDAMEAARWVPYVDFVVGQTYKFPIHHNSDEPPFDDKYDPMELWEYLRPGQKENETILPQILLYFWHKDNRLSMDLDF